MSVDITTRRCPFCACESLTKIGTVRVQLPSEESPSGEMMCEADQYECIWCLGHFVSLSDEKPSGFNLKRDVGAAISSDFGLVVMEYLHYLSRADISEHPTGNFNGFIRWSATALGWGPKP